MASERRISETDLEGAIRDLADAEESLIEARRRRDQMISAAVGQFTVRELSAICGISFSMVSRIQNRND